jgi:hypothetical protein
MCGGHSLNDCPVRAQEAVKTACNLLGRTLPSRFHTGASAVALHALISMAT